MMKSKWAFDHVPDWVKELDRLEVERRKNENGNPMPKLEPEVIEALHKRFPELKKIDEFFDEVERTADDYDFNPDKSDTPFSWAYLQLRPWTPNTPFLVVCAAVAGWSIVKLLLFINASFAAASAASLFVAFDFVMLLVLGIFVPAVFMKFGIHVEEEQTNASEAITRSTVMVMISVLAYLAAVCLFASIGYSTTAVSVDIVARAVALPVALWGWKDINEDVEYGDDLELNSFRLWRWLVTGFVCVVGAFARILALQWPESLPIGMTYTSVLEPCRVWLGTQFPVAFSLARDVGGVYFLAFLILLAAFINALYVAIASTYFLETTEHRRAGNSLLTYLCVKFGIYGTAEAWEVRRRGPSTAPPGVKAYRPSPAMLLKPRNLALFSSDTGSLVKSERTLPILQYLEEEEEMGRKKGVKHWIRPETYDGDLLATWARPLTKAQQDMPMEEFFDLLGESDYEYDSSSDQWVYSEKTKGLEDLKLKKGEDEDDLQKPVLV